MSTYINSAPGKCGRGEEAHLPFSVMHPCNNVDKLELLTLTRYHLLIRPQS